MFDITILKIWLAVKTGHNAQWAVAAARKTSRTNQEKHPWLQFVANHTGKHPKQALEEARRWMDYHE